MASGKQKMGTEPDASASELKAQGNAKVASGDHAAALELFSAGIEKGPAKDELHVFYSNRSLCHNALGNGAAALDDANKCVELKADWAKGYARVGAAYTTLNKADEAVKAYAKGVGLDPTNATLMTALQTAQAKLNGTAAPLTADGAKAEAAPTDTVIGIDLGTTYSCVAVCRAGAGRVEIVPNPDGGCTTPSWVAYSAEDGTRLVGNAAKNQAAGNPTNTINDAKRLIGRNFSEAAVQSDLKHLTCKVVASVEDKPLIKLNVPSRPEIEAGLAPEQVSAMVLQQLKKDAEEFLGAPVKRAVVTVPAHFNDAQRQATRDAGAIAGLDVLRIINEPTAAALAYGLDRSAEGADDDEMRVLIFDLGGGTFAVSVLSMEGGIFEVKSTGGDTRLGGEDFDAATSAWLIQNFCKANPSVEQPLSARAQRRVSTAAERAKRQLSAATTAEIEIESLVDGIDLKATLTRAKFESLQASFFTKCIETVKSVVKDSGLRKEHIDEVVLVGGSTRIPKIRALLSEYFGGKTLCCSINPDEAVAYGAAVQAGLLGGGLAAAGGSLSAAAGNMVLMDVVPLSLGIETTGRVMSTVVKRNTAIPCRKSDTFTTEEDWQTEVDVVVYEGERASTDACNELGRFTISGLERAKRGVPQVCVTFDVDANGILSVTALDKVTSAKASVTITSTTARNSPAEVAKMVEEAKRFAAVDDELKRKAEARRSLEDVVFSILDNEDASSGAKRQAEETEAWLQASFELLSVNEIHEKLNTLRSRR